MTTEQRLINALREALGHLNWFPEDKMRRGGPECKDKGWALLAELDARPKRTLADVKVGDEVWVKCRVKIVNSPDGDCHIGVVPNGEMHWPHPKDIRID